MKTTAAVDHFGSIRALADALEITPQAVYQWGEHVPAGRDFQIEVLTQGALKASEIDRAEQVAEHQGAPA